MKPFICGLAVAAVTVAMCGCDVAHDTVFRFDGGSALSAVRGPCDGVDCGAHGRCIVVDADGVCSCDTGYHWDGRADLTTSFLPVPLPAPPREVGRPTPAQKRPKPPVTKRPRPCQDAPDGETRAKPARGTRGRLVDIKELWGLPRKTRMKAPIRFSTGGQSPPRR
jgi:hypothetical protein